MTTSRARVLLALIILFCITLCSVSYAESGLPSLESLLGKTVPSVSLAIGREPTSTTIENDKITLSYEDFTVEEYQSLDRYLSGKDYELQSFTIEGKTALFSVCCSDITIGFDYDTESKELVVTYPDNVRLEKKPGAFSEAGGFLPDITTAFIIELPNMQSAIGRAPVYSFDENGQFTEVYERFSKSDYNKFSSYLQSYGCAVSDCKVEGNVMYIDLTYNEVAFSFTYDSSKSMATLIYPSGSHLEPTPEPTAAPTPRPTAEPQHYSESECWSVAQTYFKNLSWKNPDSVTIHGHTSTYSDNSYTFMIDYSAQNGFGGYNRKYYFITVDATTKRVTSAFGT